MHRLQVRHTSLLYFCDESRSASIGHFDIEIDVPWLKANAKQVVNIKPQVDEYTMANGRHIMLLAEGRLVNLGSVPYHWNALHELIQSHDTAVRRSSSSACTKELDEEVARAHLAQINTKLTEMTATQSKYPILLSAVPTSRTTTGKKSSSTLPILSVVDVYLFGRY